MSGYTVRYSLLRRDDACSTDAEEDLVEVSRPLTRPQRSCHCQATLCKCGKSQTTFCIVITVTIIMVLSLLLGVVYTTYPTTSSETDGVKEGSTNDELPAYGWEQVLEGAGVTSPVRAVDVNRDGVLDLILGVSYDSPLPSCTGACSHGVVAMDGENGRMLWRITTKDEVFELRCPAFDMDGDGVPDCIASGRHGTLLAFAFQLGTCLWSASAATNAAWNVLAPGVVQDVDGDGMQDMVVMNGGDSDYLPEEHNRTASRMLLLSGRTGEPVGYAFSMPDERESYSLPVIYTTSDSSQYVVFGTGGETVGGGLYILSLKHLLSLVMPGIGYDLLGSYNQWQDREDAGTGLITLYKTTAKGVMVPVSLVDLNEDGADDIISMTFDGILLAFSGKDLTHLWQPWDFTMDSTSTESYTSPALGYYNEDAVPDLMVHWQTGSWPEYDSLMIYVINGLTGELLWYKDSPIISDYSISSPLALTTSQPRRDAFIFRITSTNMPFPESAAQDEEKVKGERISRRHSGTDGGGQQFICEEMDSVFVDTVILDRGSGDSPLLLSRQHAQAFYYKSLDTHLTVVGRRLLSLSCFYIHQNSSSCIRMTNVTDELVEHRLAYMNSEEISEHTARRRHSIGDVDKEHYADLLGTERCARLTPHNIATGVLMDLNGDGGVDLVSVDTYYTKLSVEDNEPTGDMVTKSIVRVFSLKDVLHQLPSIKLEEVVAVKTVQATTSLSNLSLSEHHSWPQQFGPEQNGHL